MARTTDGTMTQRAVIAGMLFFSALPSLSGQAAATLPRLRPAFTTTTIDLAPINRLTSIAVGPQGQVLFVTSAEAADLRMTLVDSLGRRLLTFGRTGSGPGEVRSPHPVEVSATRMTVWDMENSALLEWDLKGAMLPSVRSVGLSNVSVMAKEIVGMRSVAGVWQVVGVDRASGQARNLVAATDTFMSAHFGRVDGRPKSPYAPIPGVWSEGFLVADAGSYTLALYRWDGNLVRVLHRELPPSHASAGRIDDFLATMNRQAAARGGQQMDEARLAMMRKQGMEQVVPSITPGGAIRTDSRNRIWVLGMDGDSASADLFTADRFIGRLPLPCRLFNGFWGLSGNWLALACLPDDRKFDGDAVIKLFRIADGGR